MTTARPRWLIVAPFIFLALWSGGYPVAKIVLNYGEPMTMLALRYALVIALMGIAFFVIRPPLPDKPMDWLHLAIVGTLIQALYFGMIYLAFRAGAAVGTVALLLSLQPILVGLAAPFWSGGQTSNKRWLGLMLGLLGAGITITARSNIEAPSIFGLFCTIVGLLGITVGTLWEKRFGVTHHPVVSNLVGYTAGFICILPFAFILETMQIDWTWQFAAAMTYLVIGNSVIAVGLLLAMIRAGDVSSVSALFFLVPPLAALLAWVLLGEAMPALAWAGMAVAACGVYLATRKA